VNRISTHTLVIGLAAAWLACAPGVTALAQTAPPAAGDASRVDELVKYAREKFEQAKTQPAPAGTQQRSLEEQATARPVTKLTVAEAVAMALENNIELSVERLNPQLQDLAIAQIRGAYRPTVGSTVNMTSNMPLPTSLLNLSLIHI